MPAKLKEITATVRIAWAEGSLKEPLAVIVFVLSVVMGIVTAGWEQVSQWLPFLALALVVYTLMTPTPVVAGVYRVSFPYDNIGGVFTP